MADGLLNKASIILTPTGYKAGTLYNVAPVVEPYEDFDFARTSTATRINSSGLVSNVATGVPRISYDSNGDNGHILLEPTSTNLVPYSENFSVSAGWQIDSSVTLSLNTSIAPDGVLSADNINYVGSLGSPNGKQLQRSFTIAGGTANKDFTNSIFVKGVGKFRIKNTHGGVVDNFTNDITATNNWVRYDFPVSNSSSAGNGTQIIAILAATTDDAFNLDIWGAQLENLPYATSYIPTLTGSTVTRATETATGAGSADLINSTEGVLYAEIAALDDGISQQIGVYGNSTSKQLRLEIANSVIRAQLFNGAYQANMSSTQTVTNFNKIAFKWKVNDFALWINGTEVATDSSGSTFPANDLDRLNLSGQNGISSLAQAKIKSLAVFNEALSDSELTQLTT